MNKTFPPLSQPNREILTSPHVYSPLPIRNPVVFNVGLKFHNFDLEFPDTTHCKKITKPNKFLYKKFQKLNSIDFQDE